MVVCVSTAESGREYTAMIWNLDGAWRAVWLIRCGPYPVYSCYHGRSDCARHHNR
jgi:hypothetical protein